jgi:hypothetical protein
MSFFIFLKLHGTNRYEDPQSRYWAWKDLRERCEHQDLNHGG